MTATLADRLNAAADVIEERGHAHGTLEDAQGRVCVVGAINTACGGHAHNWNEVGTFEAHAAVSKELGRLVSGWNDETRNGRFIRGKREAVALLRRTARKAAGQ